MSISEQQEPREPVPELADDEVQSTMLACISKSASASSGEVRCAHRAVDELEITRALGVTVTGSVLGTSLVGRVLGHATVGIHLGEVEGSVETAGKLRDIDVERELLVERLEDVVGGVGVEKVGAGSDVGVGSLGDELEGQSVARGGDTVGAAVVRSVECAVLSACSRVGAERRVPLKPPSQQQNRTKGEMAMTYGVSGVAVGVSGGGVQPSPVGVQHDLALLGRALLSAGALLPGDGGVDLCRLRANLLSTDGVEESERGDEGSCAGHDGDVCWPMRIQDRRARVFIRMASFPGLRASNGSPMPQRRREGLGSRVRVATVGHPSEVTMAPTTCRVYHRDCRVVATYVICPTFRACCAVVLLQHIQPACASIHR